MDRSETGLKSLASQRFNSRRCSQEWALEMARNLVPFLQPWKEIQ
jgi:hypothetical protein